ncbi:hypothetical protein Ndes2526B_g04516 [Nannochloris sp. 'desiccata']|nr:hypothetical protein KSW81_000744 [Chlorella desiccata (nom. nud.)]KAH7620595.1 putative Transmembrane protein 230 [Chlorella desiccata (nom. nud.)]
MAQIPANVYRSVLCAAGLLALGLAMFISGMVLWTTEGTSAMIGLWVCGLLVFIPGFYFTRIAYHAYKGTAGYSWTDIPDWPAE